MVKCADITWLGEDHLHEEGNGPSRNVWNGITFRIGEPVMIVNDRMIAKAKGNPFYSVEDERDVEEAEAPAPESDGETEVHGGDLSKMSIGKLRWMATQKGISHDGVGKADLREAIARADEAAGKA